MINDEIRMFCYSDNAFLLNVDTSTCVTLLQGFEFISLQCIDILIRLPDLTQVYCLSGKLVHSITLIQVALYFLLCIKTAQIRTNVINPISVTSHHASNDKINAL